MRAAPRHSEARDRFTPNPALLDPRFARLVGREAWARLPEAVRRRFGHRVEPGQTAVYAGRIRHTRMNGLGRVLAQLLRPFGQPFPLDACEGGPAAVVAITEGVNGAEQFWTRQYGRPQAGRRRFPQVVHSAKVFGGPTGCEEWTGPLGVAHAVTEDGGDLVFRSRAFRVQLGPVRLTLPRFLHPGALEVRHRDRGADGFTFTLTLIHPIFGTLLDQVIDFHDLSEVLP